MIRNFKCTDSQSLYEGNSVIKWQSIQRQAERRLQILDMATCIEDLKNLRSNRFEILKGKRKGQCSIRVNIQWRVCFNWINNEACDVEIVDYH